VTVLDDLSSGQRKNADILVANGAKFIEADILTVPEFPHAAMIYHLACPASPPFYQADPVRTWKISVIGTMRIAEWALKIGARILFTSTSEVYGDPLQHPQKESYWGNVNPIGIRSCYDEGKRAAETLLMDMHRSKVFFFFFCFCFCFFVVFLTVKKKPDSSECVYCSSVQHIRPFYGSEGRTCGVELDSSSA
jgi:UDP-glucuronate decarboxylase